MSFSGHRLLLMFVFLLGCMLMSIWMSVVPSDVDWGEGVEDIAHVVASRGANTTTFIVSSSTRTAAEHRSGSTTEAESAAPQSLTFGGIQHHPQVGPRHHRHHSGANNDVEGENNSGSNSSNGDSALRATRRRRSRHRREDPSSNDTGTNSSLSTWEPQRIWRHPPPDRPVGRPSRRRGHVAPDSNSQTPFNSNWMWSSEENCLKKDPRQKQRLRILCLGDSITYGNGSHTRLAKREPGGNYPLMLRADPVLRALLCPEVRIEVENLGWNGCSAQAGKRYYKNTIVYRAALHKARTADVVMLILGTNDSKDYNWRGSDVFEESLLSYIEEIQKAGHPRLEVLIGTPPPAFANPFQWHRGRSENVTAFHIRMDRVRHEIRDSVTAVAEDGSVTLLDLHEAVSSIPGLKDAGMRMEDGTASTDDVALVKRYYHDGVHPYSLTHEVITASVRDAVVWALNQTNTTRSLSPDERWWE